MIMIVMHPGHKAAALGRSQRSSQNNKSNDGRRSKKNQDGHDEDKLWWWSCCCCSSPSSSKNSTDYRKRTNVLACVTIVLILGLIMLAVSLGVTLGNNEDGVDTIHSPSNTNNINQPSPVSNPVLPSMIPTMPPPSPPQPPPPTPIPLFFEGTLACSVCGDQLRMSNPRGLFSFAGFTAMCQQIEQNGLKGNIPQEECAVLSKFLQDTECDCEPIPSAPSSSTVNPGAPTIIPGHSPLTPSWLNDPDDNSSTDEDVNDEDGDSTDLCHVCNKDEYVSFPNELAFPGHDRLGLATCGFLHSHNFPVGMSAEACAEILPDLRANCGCLPIPEQIDNGPTASSQIIIASPVEPSVDSAPPPANIAWPVSSPSIPSRPPNTNGSGDGFENTIGVDVSGFEMCYICGPGHHVGNLDGRWDPSILGLNSKTASSTTITCKEVQIAGHAGMIAPDVCETIRHSLGPCECRPD
mmetsp:Transcript_20136/g.29117  ORF Transcript_20136/g.29117 Transcript_20136/m.29117 type:complete len:465 (-) Transcript_20136:382-1776(-)